MSYANNITQKVELAAKLWAESCGITTVSTFTTGIASDEISLPYVCFTCQKADIEDNFDGCWSAELVISVVSSANDATLDEHRERAGEVFSWFMTDTVAGDLTAALTSEPFTAQFVLPLRQSWDLVAGGDSQQWESQLALTVKCCGSAIG